MSLSDVPSASYGGSGGRRRRGVEVKICGVGRRRDVDVAAEAGADYVGVVLAESPRRLDEDEARDLAARAAEAGLRPVGVFVDRPVDEVRELAGRLGLEVAQLHGEEAPEDCRSLRADGLEVWKALRPRSRDELAELVDRYRGAADALLVEGFSPEAAGGTGTGLPREWLRGPHGPRIVGKLVLAGGLDPDNVADAIREVRPDVVDVSSGVEAEPGRKDPERIRAFVAAVRGASGGRDAGSTSGGGAPRSPGGRGAADHRGTADGAGDAPTAEAATSDAADRFGPYGGRYVPETLVPALEELEAAWDRARDDPAFHSELDACLRDYVGRPSPLGRAERLGEELGGVRVWLKREDLNHTGAHKINNTVGQALLARRMGKERVIAETGAGQHGVATATACALLGQTCVVYMGEEDMRRQALNVERMRLLGAEVRPVSTGRGTLKDATNEAIRDWVENVRDTHYIIGSVVGPAPYPRLVRDLQRVIGDEARGQLRDRGVEPDAVFACVGGGSNAIGIFTAFLEDDVELVGVEAAGEGLDSGRHAAPLAGGEPGVLHGSLSYLLQDEAGQVTPAHSVSAGLDYPGVGPEHAHLKDAGRVRYESVDDRAALRAFREISRLEGILPALETAHAVARLRQEAERWQGRDVVLCLSGRGDKDVAEVARLLEEQADGDERDPDA